MDRSMVIWKVRLKPILSLANCNVFPNSWGVILNLDLSFLWNPWSHIGTILEPYWNQLQSSTSTSGHGPHGPGLQNWSSVATAVFGLLAALRRRRYVRDAQGGPQRDALRQAVDEAPPWLVDAWGNRMAIVAVGS